ncbi:hypothetical protein AB833_19435 [Chromatiales bacterium (ex Bugula neritina AB1)]|nr:hypothetical protein AB833_19435 [Chromatiales bacterium (ex Bugula neritina AB1)]
MCHHIIFESESRSFPSSRWSVQNHNGETLLEASTLNTSNPEGSGSGQWGLGNSRSLAYAQNTVPEIWESRIPFTFSVPVAGNYQVLAVGRAYDPNQDSDNANDVWFHLPSGSDISGETARGDDIWKFFSTKNGNIEVLRPSTGSRFCKRLTPGQHTFYIMNRSYKMQVDRVIIWNKDACDFNSAWLSKDEGVYEIGDSNNTPVNCAQSSWSENVVNPPQNCDDVNRHNNYQPGDLVIISDDCSNDRDACQAAVASRMIVDNNNVPESDLIGVCGAESAVQTGLQQVAHNLVNEMYTNSYDARIGSARTSAVAAIANRVVQAIDNCQQVFHAEGGPVDFARDLYERVAQLRPQTDLVKFVTVIQHSTTNENNSGSGDLSWLQNNVTYLKIADGNRSSGIGAGTADFQIVGPTNSDRAAISNPLKAHPVYGQYWQDAFGCLPDTDRIDFSDSVETLEIFGVPLSTVADAFDFVSFYG